MRKLSLYFVVLLFFPLILALIPITPLHTVQAIGENLDMPTQHNDNQRTGANLKETLLNTTNVKQASFGKLFSKQVDGQIYAQPLYLSNMNIGGQVRNVVFVVTMHNTIYCFDADNSTAGALWSKTLTPSVLLPDTNVGPNPYYDINTEIGILSTPVISRANNVIYLVAMTVNAGNRNNPNQNTYAHKLYALDLTDGSFKYGSPKTITATTAGTGEGGTNVTLNSKVQLQRTGLTLANGRVYFGFGSIGDNGLYHGWVLGYNMTTLGQEVVYTTSPNGLWGGVWQSGQGITVDAAGNLYFLSGNLSTSTSNIDTKNKGDSVIKLSPNSPATLLDWFTPYNFEALDEDDLDLGSSGGMIIPGTALIICGSKEGKLYILDTNNLGKFHAGSDSQIVQSFKAASGNIHGTPIYWEGPSGKQIYVWAEGDKLKAYNFNGMKISSTTPNSQSAETLISGMMPGGFLTVSADGNKAGTGIVWASTPLNQDANHATVEGILRAYDASDLSHLLWDSKQNDTRDHLGNFAKFAPPTVANGKVYMATFSGQLIVYGLLNGTPTPSPTPVPGTMKLEAENAALILASKATDHANYSGTGFVDRYVTANVGASTTFTVNIASASVTNVSLRYANGTGIPRTLSLYVNGVKTKQTTLAATANWDTWNDQVEALTLKAGLNTIAYKYDTGDTANVNLDYIALLGTASTPTPVPTATPTPVPTLSPTPIPTATPTPVPMLTKYEAESAALSIAKIATDHANYSGTGFVDRYVTLNVGASTTFTVNAALAGVTNVSLRYANGTGISRTLSLYVNSVKIKQTTLAATANWDTWSDQVEALTLKAGLNTIAYKYDAGDTANVNLDYIALLGTVSTPVPTATPTPVPTISPTPIPTATPSPTVTKYEAENAALSIAKIATDHANYSGTGFVDRYVTLNVGASTTFTVAALSSGVKNVSLRYANGTGISRTLTLYVNGVKIKQTTLAATANWDTWGDQVESLALSAGSNTITYKYDAGDSANVNLDYISMVAS